MTRGRKYDDIRQAAVRAVVEEHQEIGAVTDHYPIGYMTLHSWVKAQAIAGGKGIVLPRHRKKPLTVFLPNPVPPKKQTAIHVIVFGQNRFRHFQVS